jgi:hypothetical protein
VENVEDYKDIPVIIHCKQVTPTHIRELYQKASDGKKVEDVYEDDDDDDNDSFITINTSDEESDSTLENSESSDSGIIEHDFDTHGSYGINPMFSKGSKDQMSTMSRACKDFVYIPQKEETVIKRADGLSSQIVKQKKSRITSIGRSMRKIAILNDDCSIVVNESCLI